ERARQHFDREIVAGRAEAARDEHDLASRARAQDPIPHFFRVVPPRGLEARPAPEREQPLREEGLVRVDDLAAQQLVADGEDLGRHARATLPSASSPAPSRSAPSAPATRSSSITPRPPR